MTNNEQAAVECLTYLRGADELVRRAREAATARYGLERFLAEDAAPLLGGADAARGVDHD